MITWIEFKDKIFNTDDDNNLINPTTKNLIILCNSSDTKSDVAREIAHMNDENGADYNSSHGANAAIKTLINYKPTTVFDIDDEQRIVVTVEDPYILTAKDKYDIWFADINQDEQIEIYPFVAFRGHQETWDKGIDRVYRDVLFGRYGSFGKYGR